MQSSCNVHAEVGFVGELTIANVVESHARLLRAIEEAPSVLLSVAPDATVDLTFVQLLESARRTAREAGRELALAAPAAGQLRETLDRGGFLGAPERRAFWLLEEEA